MSHSLQCAAHDGRCTEPLGNAGHDRMSPCTTMTGQQKHVKFIPGTKAWLNYGMGFLLLLTDLRPLHGHPLGAGESVANLSGDRSRGMGALPLIYLGELSVGVLLHTHHAAVLPASAFTTRHGALGPGALLPAAHIHTQHNRLMSFNDADTPYILMFCQQTGAITSDD